MRKAKKALFISMEMVVVIIVTIIIIGVVIASVANLMKTNRVNKIVNEYNLYKESINKFKGVYDVWPGDMERDQLVGEMVDSGITDGMTFIESKQSSEIQTVNNNQVNSYIFGSEIIGPLKSMLTFRSLIVSGILPSKLNTFTPPNTKTYKVAGTVNLYPSAYDFVKAGYLPTSAVEKDLAWAFYSSKSGSDSPRHGTGYAENDTFRKTMTTDWEEGGKLVLFNYTNIPNAKFCSTGCTYFSDFYGALFFGSATGSIPDQNDVNRTGLPAFPVAALPAEIAGMVDQKIDDGLPAGTGSRVFGIDVVTSSIGKGTESAGSVFGCTNSLKDTLTQPNKWTDLRYTDSSLANGYQGCVMFFKL